MVYSLILFVTFLGINQFRRVGLRFVCWFYYVNTQRLTESGFMEKPGIEPVTPGLQGIMAYPLHHSGFTYRVLLAGFDCLICFITSTQQSFSYAGRFFLGLTSTKLG